MTSDKEVDVVVRLPRIVISHCLFNFPGQVWKFSEENGFINGMTNTHMMVGGYDGYVDKKPGFVTASIEPKKGFKSMETKDPAFKAGIWVKAKYAKAG